MSRYRLGDDASEETTRPPQLTCHDVVQRVCERLRRCSYHEPVRGLLRYHAGAKPGQLLTLLLLAQHLLSHQYPLQLRAGAPWVVGGVVVRQGLDGDEGGLERRRWWLWLGLWRRGQGRLLRRLGPVPVEDGAHLRERGVVILLAVCLVLRTLLFVVIILFLKITAIQKTS